jgi:hypothetical protein
VIFYRTWEHIIYNRILVSVAGRKYPLDHGTERIAGRTIAENFNRSRSYFFGMVSYDMEKWINKLIATSQEADKQIHDLEARIARLEKMIL